MINSKQKNLDILFAPHQLTDYLNTHVPQDALIETWERELGVLTEHRYHYLDQSALARSQVAVRGGSRDYAGYAFGQAYFESVQPAYLVIGRYARVAKIYDAAYLAAHANLVFTVGDDETRYEVYQLR